MYSYVHTPSYNDCITAATKDARRTVDLMQTLAELARQPFGNPKLQSHRMHNAEGKTYISYVGGPKGQRLIWRLIGKRTIALLLFGEHDPIERQAERLRLTSTWKRSASGSSTRTPPPASRCPTRSCGSGWARC